jgi:hypothetical protein
MLFFGSNKLHICNLSLNRRLPLLSGNQITLNYCLILGGGMNAGAGGPMGGALPGIPMGGPMSGSPMGGAVPTGGAIQNGGSHSSSFGMQYDILSTQIRQIDLAAFYVLKYFF